MLRDIRPVEVSAYEVRFETPPGRQAQVDFAHFRTVFTDEPGVERIIWLFSMVLGHSRMLWGRFVVHQDLQTLLRCHTAAFEALGGVAEQILYDRMRTVFHREDPDTNHIVTELSIEIVKIAEAPAQEEVLADVVKRTLDLALRLGPVRLAGLGQVAIATIMSLRSVGRSARFGERSSPHVLGGLIPAPETQHNRVARRPTAARRLRQLT